VRARIVAGAQALVLYGAVLFLGPILRARIIRLLPDRPWSDHVLDAAMLAALALAAFVLTRPLFGARGHPRPAPSFRSRFGAAGAALFALGLFALALRLVDPAYDARELGGRGLDSPGALAAFLTLLPLGVAAEEIVFRSCQSRLRIVLRPGPAAVTVALAFAAYHWYPGWIWDRHGIETELALLAGGLVFAVTYEVTASLPILVGVHLIYDNLAVVQAWLNVRQARSAETALFVLWLSIAGALAWKAGRPRLAKPFARRPPGASADFSQVPPLQ